MTRASSSAPCFEMFLDPRSMQPDFVRQRRSRCRNVAAMAMSRAGESRNVRLGLAENLPQFLLLMMVNALVGGMVGLERTVVPLIGAEEFRIASTTLIASFIVSFGVVKAFTNLVTGHLADLYGRKRLLILGWLV